MIELYRVRLFVGRMYRTDAISKFAYEALLDKLDEEEERASNKPSSAKNVYCVHVEGTKSEDIVKEVIRKLRFHDLEVV